MNKPTDTALLSIQRDDENCNDSPNEHFETVLNARLSRRSLLRGSLASAAGALLGATGLSACGSDNAPATLLPVAPAPAP
ncbi:MAG: PhoX family protein, partial [Telluria sp.]